MYCSRPIPSLVDKNSMKSQRSSLDVAKCHTSLKSFKSSADIRNQGTSLGSMYRAQVHPCDVSSPSPGSLSLSPLMHDLRRVQSHAAFPSSNVLLWPDTVQQGSVSLGFLPSSPHCLQHAQDAVKQKQSRVPVSFVDHQAELTYHRGSCSNGRVSPTSDSHQDVSRLMC